jgi:hypothetical protein
MKQFLNVALMCVAATVGVLIWAMTTLTLVYILIVVRGA